MLTLLGVMAGNGLVSFLIACLIVIVIVYVIKLVMAELGVGGNVAKIIYLILAVIAIYYLFNRFGGAL